MAGGWCYVKEIVLPQYAEEMLGRGIAVLMFDLRCLGESTGEPRQHLDPVGQIEDYRNVVTFAHGLPEVDSSRIAAWGISYSGGHVLALAALEPRIAAVVSIIPVIDGYRTMQLVQGHRNDRWERLNDAILKDRVQRYAGGERAYIPHNSKTPDTELCTWPFTSSNDFFSKAKATFAPRYENRSTLESTELLMNYSVVPYLDRILGLPLHMTVVEGDTHTPWDVQMEGYNRIPSPRKEITLLERVSHIGLYSDKSNLVRAAVPGAEFLARKFIKSRDARLP
jgi:fermentation-respiration switch protein FrsA (DUF1100 family)